MTGRHFIARIPATPSKQNPRRVCKVCADKEKYISGKEEEKKLHFTASNVIHRCVLFFFLN